jgi:hypothetical protein
MSKRVPRSKCAGDEDFFARLGAEFEGKNSRKHIWDLNTVKCKLCGMRMVEYGMVPGNKFCPKRKVW